MVGADDERMLEMVKELLDESRAEPAAKLARSWLETHPGSARGYELLAAASSQLGQWNEAEAAAAECVRRRPASARAWANWGTALRKVGRRAEARDAQQRALSLEPGNPRAIKELRELGVATPELAVMPLQSAGLLGTETAPTPTAIPTRPLAPTTVLDAAPEGEARASTGQYVLWAIIGFLGGWLAAFGGLVWAARHHKDAVRRKLGYWTAGWGVAGGLVEALLMLVIYTVYAAMLEGLMDATDDPLNSPLFNP